MKRLFALVISVAILAAAAAPTLAQQRNGRRDSRTSTSRGYYDSQGFFDNSDYYDNRSYYDYGYDNRSFWQKHRDKLTVAIGAGAGTALGAMLGGKRAAAIGAAAGAGSSALYTYRIRNRRYGY
jgi:hypothetical protein